MTEPDLMNSDKRLKSIGLKATWVYVIVILTVIPCGAMLGWIKFTPLELNQLGDLLAGLFGPLAIFWLILGFFQQGDELRNSVSALRLQAEELKQSVEQQKAIVKTAEKQLELDIEVREEQTRLFVSNELPLFQVEPRGGSGTGHGYRYDFLVRNVGADATTYTLSMTGGDDAFPDRDLNFLQTGQSYEFSIPRNESTSSLEENWAELTISCTNKRNWTRVQKFSISSHQHVKPISTEPPTN
jgi:hypothetical protein